jgi:hypothetical protein
MGRIMVLVFSIMRSEKQEPSPSCGHVFEDGSLCTARENEDRWTRQPTYSSAPSLQFRYDAHIDEILLE